MKKTPEEILDELSQKFDKNRKSWSTLNHQDLSKLFLLAMAIAEIGQVLQQSAIPQHQKRCCVIFDEIFSDIITATFLATCAIDKPANIILRRVMELGIAVIYLWDMPHIMCSWEDLDHDLSFSEMVNHVNSDGYKKYVSESLDRPIEEYIANPIILKSYYGKLSDIVHGKITSFESDLPNRFTFIKDDWSYFVINALSIVKTLVDAYFKRFSVKDKIIEILPALKRL
ncbi:MAG: hypothetical protein ABSE00_06840 [Chitinispirillaceae bacterium]|jgi:hypothetical protein